MFYYVRFKTLLSNFTSFLVNVGKQNQIKYLIIRDTLSFLRKHLKYNASLNYRDDSVKLQAHIQMKAHGVEKGLSLRNTRKTFGYEKVCDLINDMKVFKEKFNDLDPTFLEYPLGVINAYIEYLNQYKENEKISQSIREQILYFTHKNSEGGIIHLNREEVMSDAKGDFRSLLNSRHSIRCFTDKVPNDNILNEALNLASRTPSACNRQGWRTHVYRGDLCRELIRVQEYCRGFEEEIHCAIMVTGDLRVFTDHEIFMAHSDAALYAMNLINALHYLGLGSIPLCAGAHTKKTRKFKKFNIPDWEVPVVIIGCGYLPEEFNVAFSKRYPIDKTNNYEN